MNTEITPLPPDALDAGSISEYPVATAARSGTMNGTAQGQGSAMLRGAYRSGAAVVLAVLRLARVALAAAAGGLVATGCTMSGQPVFDITAGGGPGPGTVAFESIDGPPEPLFRRLVARLNQEANARKIAMVSREQPAQYVVRGYVAAHVQGQKTTITWVWDVFTADHERAVRLTGEVPGAPSERAWAAADDAVVGRMAQDGMSRLAAFLGGSGPASSEASSPNVTSTSGQAPLAFFPPSRP